MTLSIFWERAAECGLKSKNTIYRLLSIQVRRIAQKSYLPELAGSGAMLFTQPNKSNHGMASPKWSYCSFSVCRS
jgi:hypothetical protein